MVTLEVTESGAGGECARATISDRNPSTTASGMAGSSSILTPSASALLSYSKMTTNIMKKDEII